MAPEPAVDLVSLVQRAFGPGARLDRQAPLAGDASSRSYERLWLSGTSAPATTIVMRLADRGVALSSDELATLPEGMRELPFLNVQRFLASFGWPVPAIYLDASEAGVVLLEDVGDVALWDVVRDEPDPAVIRARYRQAIEVLVRLHVEGSRHRDESCLLFHQSFDGRLFEWEFEHFLEYGLGTALGIEVTATDLECLREAFRDIARRLDAAPRVPNHRDYHSWNLHWQDGRLRVIDFQDALLAPLPYDLATLLGDRDTPAVVTADLEATLLDDFRAAWSSAGEPPLDRQEFETTYFLCALQKALKVIGRFHYLDRVKGKPGYLRFLPGTRRRVAHLLPRFPEYGEMGETLRRLLAL